MSDGIRVTTNNFKEAAVDKRLLSWVIDMALVNFLLLLLMPGYWVEWSQYVIALFSGKADLLAFMVRPAFITAELAPVVYLTVMSGIFSRTVGMFVTKIRIAKLDGARLSWGVAVLRSLCYLLMQLPLLLGFLPVIFDKKKMGWHDKLSKTMVILKR